MGLVRPSYEDMALDEFVGYVSDRPQKADRLSPAGPSLDMWLVPSGAEAPDGTDEFHEGEDARPGI